MRCFTCSAIMVLFVLLPVGVLAVRRKLRDTLFAASNVTNRGRGRATLANLDLFKDYKIKFFGFNEQSKKNVFNEVYGGVLDSMDGDEDFFVTCQTEAKSSFHEYVETLAGREEWILIGHGKHTGMTGFTEVNSQIINVYARRTLALEELAKEVAQYPLDWEVPSNWVDARGWNLHRNGIRRGAAFANLGGGSDTVLEAADIKLNDGRVWLSAKTRLHETSGDGKGGASTIISVLSGDGKPRTKLLFVCAHLDSDSSAERERGAIVLLEEATDEARSKSAAGVPWPQLVGELDAVFMLGDLNYRLWYKTDEQPVNSVDAMGWRIYSKDGREAFSRFDPLRAPDTVRNALDFSYLTRPQENGMDGFGMVCNQPFRNYLPTYKRRDPEACKLLGTLWFDRCGSVHVSQCEEACSNTEDEHTAECEICYRKMKQCEYLALACTTKVKEKNQVEVVVDGGAALGIRIVAVDNPMKPEEHTLWVAHVEPGSVFDIAGVRQGYVLTGIQETDISETSKDGNHTGKKNKWQPLLKKVMSSTDATDAGLGALMTKFTSRTRSSIDAMQILDKLSHLQSVYDPDVKTKIYFAQHIPEWILKQDLFYQLGWLDRICYKGLPRREGMAPVEVELTEDTGMMESTQSDHMPVIFAMTVKRGTMAET